MNSNVVSNHSQFQNLRPTNVLAKRKVLAITTVWPEPNSSAAGQHILQMLALLYRAGTHIHVCSSAQFDDDHSADLHALGYQSSPIKLNCSSFDAFVANYQPDIVLYDRFMIEEQYSWRVRQACPQALSILDTEDLHSLRQLRRDICKRNPLQALDLPSLLSLHQTHAILHNPLAMREIGAILRSDLTLIISQAEMQLLTHYPVEAQSLHYHPFIIDAPDETAQASGYTFAEKQHFIWMGNYRHAPNWDAVQFLAQRIWPKIRARLPHAELHCYGAYTPEKAQQYHQPKRGMLIKGMAKDALQTFAQYRVQLAPLRFGAGLKGKVFDASRVATATAASDIALEGIALEGISSASNNEATHLDWPLFSMANESSVDAYIEYAVSLYQDQSTHDRAVSCASAIMRDEFDGATHAQRFLDAVTDALSQLSQRRQSRFLQSLLCSQGNNAQQFMSQWIEAKQTVAQLRQLIPTSETDSNSETN